MRKPRLTYSNVVSTIALGLVLTGGTAVAASTIGSAGITNGSVRSIDLKDNGIKSVDIQNGQVQGPDLAKATKLSTSIVQSGATLSQGEVRTVIARCTGTDRAIGSGSVPSTFVFIDAATVRANQVEFLVVHVGAAGTPPSTFTGQVVCLRGGVLN